MIQQIIMDGACLEEIGMNYKNLNRKQTSRICNGGKQWRIEYLEEYIL
jgi:hypothetical protein